MFLLIKLYSGWIWCSFVAKLISTVSQGLLPCGDKYSIFNYFWLKKKTFWKFGLSSTYLVVTYLVSFILWFPTISLLFSYQCLPTCYTYQNIIGLWTMSFLVHMISITCHIHLLQTHPSGLHMFILTSYTHLLCSLSCLHSYYVITHHCQVL